FGVHARAGVRIDVEPALEVDVTGHRGQLAEAEVGVDAARAAPLADPVGGGRTPVAAELVAGDVGVAVAVGAAGRVGEVGTDGSGHRRDGAEELADTQFGTVVLGLQLQAQSK